MVSSWRRKRPGLVVVALCLGGALTACGSGDDGEGYAAVGAGTSPKDAAAPSGSVTLVPLDPGNTGDTSGNSSPSPRPPGGTGAGIPDGTPPDAPGTPGTGRTATAPPPTRTGGAPAAPGPGTPAPKPPSSAPGTPGTPGTKPTSPTSPTRPTTPPGTTAPPAPAALTLSAPTLADTDKRWCENVTVTFRNTGGTATRSGTVTFATHIIGALGVDWATIGSSQPLPAPIAAGETRTRTYTVCVESWRVPLGMRVDTRTVTAAWR
ncbi:hypothetical protein [Streptomyces sp. NPDC093111]|uniref:hypothetical protein n=1 Tax=Streptomyces sp. NPDC093111 TaxID=3154978 RepID=UPI0034420D1D